MHLATLGIAVGLAVMLLSSAIGLGFKHVVAEKITGFAGHAVVIDSRTAASSQIVPVKLSDEAVEGIKDIDNVRNAVRFSQTVGILKTETDFRDIAIKGISSDYDTLFLHRHLIEGYIPRFDSLNCRNDIVLSSLLARELGLQAGDRVYAYFFDRTLRTRRFTIAGIYETNLNRFDRNMVIGNLSTVNQLNGWNETDCSGLEITTLDFDKINETSIAIVSYLSRLNYAGGRTLSCYTVRELYGQVFEWLKLLDLNVWIILGLMLCVACCTVISGLLITMLQKTATIGTLKALGSTNRLIGNIFLSYSFFIIVRGLVIGNIIGLGIALLQSRFNVFGVFFHLDPQSYYIDRVPILFDASTIVLLNVATLLIAMLALIIPGCVVARVAPIKAIRRE